MGKRQEAAKLTRQKIIDAVKELSLSKPYDQMSIEEITQTAGVAKGTFYVYFKRREDVTAEIAYENFQALAKELSEKNIAGVEKISWYLRKSIDVIEFNGLLISQQWFRAVVAPSEDEVLGMRKLNFDLELIEACLKEAAVKGEIAESTDAAKLSRLIVSSFYGAIFTWCMSNGAVNFREVAEDFCTRAIPAMMKDAQHSED